MTWAELHGALRGRGLIRAEDAVRAVRAVHARFAIAQEAEVREEHTDEVPVIRGPAEQA
jgi:hypothetical protein